MECRVDGVLLCTVTLSWKNWMLDVPIDDTEENSDRISSSPTLEMLSVRAFFEEKRNSVSSPYVRPSVLCASSRELEDLSYRE